jgi:hypothetical protein
MPSRKSLLNCGDVVKRSPNDKSSAFGRTSETLELFILIRHTQNDPALKKPEPIQNKRSSNCLSKREDGRARQAELSEKKSRIKDAAQKVYGGVYGLAQLRLSNISESLLICGKGSKRQMGLGRTRWRKGHENNCHP